MTSRTLERSRADAPSDLPTTPGPDAPTHASLVAEPRPGLELALSVVLPGLAARRRAPLVAAALVTAGVIAPLVPIVIAARRRDDLIALGFDRSFLLLVAATFVAAVLARLLAIAEVAYTHLGHRALGRQVALAVVAALALGAPALVVATRAVDARSDIAGVFSGSDEPLFVPASEGGDPSATPGASAGDPVGGSEFRTVLLLGGDAGPGRWGMRTDSMILVSVHQPSGRTALISIPRNLTRLQFPPGTPLAELHPDGFDDLANAVFTEVATRPDLVEHYGASGLQPEAVALVGAIGYSLDVRIDDFMLVNMQGFTEVIDAVGGVTLELGQSVPLPPSLPGERPLPSSIGPGVVDMDGAMAIAYARSRSADSDYQRMGRQRQLLAALGSQVSAGEALSAFGAVTGALDDSLRTSLSSGGFQDLVDRLGDNSAIQESVGLAPPLVQPGNPDYEQLRSIVDSVQAALVAGTPSGVGA